MVWLVYLFHALQDLSGMELNALVEINVLLITIMMVRIVFQLLFNAHLELLGKMETAYQMETIVSQDTITTMGNVL